VHRLLTPIVAATAACSIPGATFLAGDGDADPPDSHQRDATSDASPCGNAVLDVGEDCDAATIRFVATVIEVSDPDNTFSPAITVGEPTWGRFVYSYGLTDTSTDPARGDYVFTNPVVDTTGIFVRLAGWTFHPGTANGEILVADEPADVIYAITGNLYVEPSVPLLQDVTLQLDDNTGAAVVGVALPHGPFPARPAWSSAVVRFRGDNGTMRWSVVAQIDSLDFEEN
jgi:hypothetical protein